MIDIAKGRYWDLPLSLVDGCTPCSPGCRGCWSAGLAHRFGEYTIKCGNEPPRFMGVVKTHPDRLSIPLRRRKPTVWAVWNDLFHEAVPDSFIGRSLSTAIGEYRHTFLVLTKRVERMASLMSRFYADAGEKELRRAINVWSGLTVCNQAEADAKIPVFLQVPGKKFLSLEPLLGPIKIPPRFLRKDCADMCSAENRCEECSESRMQHFGPRLIDAVILGGETGPGARPMHPEWVRSVRDQCAAAGVPFFFKQWGEWAIRDSKIHGDIPQNPVVRLGENGLDTRDLANCVNAGHEVYMQRVGRTAAGRLLDGRTHDALPWVTP